MNKMKFRYLRDKQKLEPQFKLFTDDPILNLCQKTFKTQYETLKDLRKNLDTFACGVKNLINAIESMYDTFCLLYETHWTGSTKFSRSCRESLNAWQIFLEEFKVNILTNVESYIQEFPVKKKAMDKRNKRASEYQKQKYYFNSTQSSKKSDPAKIQKSRDEMELAKKEFEHENKLLLDDLPKFVDKRINVYSSIWSALFYSEEILFQKLITERKNQMEVVINLIEHNNNNEYTILRQAPSSSNLIGSRQMAQSTFSLYTDDSNFSDVRIGKSGSVWDVSQMNNFDSTPSHDHVDNNSLNRAASYQIAQPYSEISVDNHETQSVKKRISFSNHTKPPLVDEQFGQNTHQNHQYKLPTKLESLNDNSDVECNDNQPDTRNRVSDINDEDKGMSSDPEDHVYQTLNKVQATPERRLSSTNRNTQVDNKSIEISIKSNSSHSNSSSQRKKFSQETDENNNNSNNTRKASSNTSLKIGGSNQFYYSVIAKYNYARQDKDELDLQKDDVILVLPWESDDQEEDGWLYGENILTKDKGLFPENHTNRL